MHIVPVRVNAHLTTGRMHCDHGDRLVPSGETMSSKRVRPGGVEVPAWWAEEARDKMAELKLRQEDVAIEAGKLIPDWVPDQSRVSRCLRGDNATLPLLDAISAVLGITSPVLVAATPGEAAAMAAAQAATRKREQLLSQGKAKTDAIRAKAVARQGAGVQLSQHGGDEGRGPRGAARGRREADRS